MLMILKVKITEWVEDGFPAEETVTVESSHETLIEAVGAFEKCHPKDATEQFVLVEATVIKHRCSLRS